ncbi:hypothetical protein N665_0218s0002 [Sinapis alba]|nr:hypothetical protein N665_0218s0002 [Sinapis alba]
MADLVLPNLPNKIICKIIAIVGEKSFWIVNPFMRDEKRGYSVVHEPSVLKRCNKNHMLNFMSCRINKYGKFREFFLKCVNVGNINTMYYEGLHLAMKCGLEEGIQVLKANVHTHIISALTLGIFTVYLDKDTESNTAFHEFAIKHKFHRSEALLEMGDQLELRLSLFHAPYLNTYGLTFKFTDDEIIQ